MILPVSGYGSSLVYSTYLGGAHDRAVSYGIAFDTAGNIYVAGVTRDPTFPVTSSGYDTVFKASLYTGFVSKIAPSLSGVSSLKYSTFLGGANIDDVSGIALDSAGNIYVTGWTSSTTFPVTANAYDTDFNSAVYAAFLSKINPNVSGSSSLVYSTLLGSGYAEANGIALGKNGNVYITGIQSRTNFPVTANAVDTGYYGGQVGFISEFNTSSSGASSLVYSTLLGGQDNYACCANAIAVDTAGKIYVTGYADSHTFPTTTTGYNQTFHGGQDTFMSVINPKVAGLAGLAYSTLIGGDPENELDQGYGIALDPSSNVYITGVTEDNLFPVTANAYDTSYQGSSKVFLCKINPSISGVSSLVYSTFLGGSNSEQGNAVTVDTVGKAYITGDTYSSDFPVTSDAYDNQLKGGSDAFVSVLNPGYAGTSSLIYSSYLGGNNISEGQGIAQDNKNNVYITGYTYASNFPVTSNAVINTFPGTVGSNYCGFATVLNITPVVAVNDWMLYDSPEVAMESESGKK